jgi:hypothetical protein
MRTESCDPALHFPARPVNESLIVKNQLLINHIMVVSAGHAKLGPKTADVQKNNCDFFAQVLSLSAESQLADERSLLWLRITLICSMYCVIEF